MKRLIIITVVLTLGQLSADGQMWNKPEATWSFSWGWVVGHGQDIYTLHHDTVILGKPCKNLWRNHRQIMYPEGTISNWEGLAGFYFYEEDSVVYVYGLPQDSNNDFDTLYNFKAKPNDSWTFNLDIPEICDSVFIITVTDTGHITFGQSILYYLKVQYSFDQYGIPIYITDTIFESFGSKGQTFLDWPNICTPDGLEPYYYTLNCYSDSSISWGTNCGLTIDVEELSSVTHTLVYPNPVDSRLHIQSATGLGLLTDLAGKVLFTFSFNNGQTDIDMSTFTDGIYFLKTSDSYFKIIVNH